jgi:hypothetical protein
LGPTKMSPEAVAPLSVRTLTGVGARSCGWTEVSIPGTVMLGG